MNILFFTENFYKGGMDSVIISLCNGWPYSDDVITLLCNDAHPGVETYRTLITRPGVRIVTHDWPVFSSAQERIPRRWWRKPLIPFLKYGLFLHNAWKIWRFCKREGIERVLSVNGAYPGGDSCRAASVAAFFACGATGVHNVHNMAGHAPRLLWPMEYAVDALLARCSRAVVAVSQACTASLRIRPGLLTRENRLTIHNGISLGISPVGQHHYRCDLGIPESAPMLVMLGTYEPRKGHGFLLRVFEDVHEQHPDAHLVFCGGGSAQERDKVRHALPAHLAGNVHCLGFVADGAVLMAEADVLVSGSQAFESFGLTPLEAAVAGTPCVVTDVGGLPEVVLDGVTGFVAPRDQPDQFARKILRLLDDRELGTRLVENARARIASVFSVQTMATRYADLLREGRRPDAEEPVAVRMGAVSVAEDVADTSFLRPGFFAQPLRNEWPCLLRRGAASPRLLLSGLSFLFGKAFKRAVRIIRERLLRRAVQTAYGVAFYPPQLIPAFSAVRDAVPCTTQGNEAAAFPSPLPSGDEAPRELVLASRTLRLHGGGIPWDAEFDDPEDTESLHRYNFLRAFPAGNAQWALGQVAEWCRRFMPECQPDMGPPEPRWESYTVAERISNVLWYVAREGVALPSGVADALRGQAAFLVPRFEYYGPGTGNHPLNNARALYLAGVFLGVEGWKVFARTVMAERLEQLVTVDGFLREGSSHYHLLVTRWLREIAEAASSGDVATQSLVVPYLRVMQEKGSFWTAGGRFALFGDISPDFSPERVLEAVPLAEPAARSETWPASGWHALREHGFTVFVRHEPARPGPSYPWHQHNDILHVSLYDGDTPLLVDPGRRNYADEDGVSGTSAFAHNTFCLDGCPASPERPNRYPVAWARTRNVAEWPAPSGEYILRTDGFARFGHGPAERRIAVYPDRLVITDAVRAAGGTLFAFFHWAPEVTIRFESRDTFHVTAPGRSYRAVVASALPVTWHVPTWTGDALSGCSSAYGEYQTSPVLVLQLGEDCTTYSLTLQRNA